MPRPVRFKTAAVGELLKQMRFLSPATLRRQMQAVEKLAREIDPERTYPEEFIVYRVTGYRPGDADAILFGAALVGDLAQLVTELSKALAIKADARRPAVTLEALAQRWGVSLKSIGRYRHRGLICHQIMVDSEPTLACYEDEVARFQSLHPKLLENAAGFERIDKATVQRIVEEARAMHAASGASLNQVAQALARKHDRSHEAVRGVLRRHDASSDEPIFAEAGPLSERQRRVVYRAWRLGVTPTDLAKKLKKTTQTIHRAINAQRLAALKGLPIETMELRTFSRKDAATVIFSPESVQGGLGADERFFDAFSLIEACKGKARSENETEAQRLAAYHWLKLKAREAMHGTARVPTSESIDAIEAQLRWASRLKRRLVESSLPAALRAIEQALNRPLSDQPSAQVLMLVTHAVEVASQTVDAYDPGRGSGLAHAVGLAMSRSMARLHVPDRAGRAAARHQGEALATAAIFDTLNPWQGLLDLSFRQRAHVLELKPMAQRVVRDVVGLNEARPKRVTEVAEAMGKTPSHIARMLHRSVIELRRAAAE